MTQYLEASRRGGAVERADSVDAAGHREQRLGLAVVGAEKA